MGAENTRFSLLFARTNSKIKNGMLFYNGMKPFWE